VIRGNGLVIKEYEHLPRESANGRFPLIGCPNCSTETLEDMRLRLLHLLRLQGAASYLLPLGQRHCGCMSAAHQAGALGAWCLVMREAVLNALPTKGIEQAARVQALVI
jgi:hypothetical protein